MWKFLVKNQSIEILEREVLADHQIQYVQFKFTFDGDWKKFHKVVQFSQCNEIYSIVLGFDGTTCYLPAELHVGAVKMSVFGYDAASDTTVRATTVPVTLNIRESGFVGDDDTPIPPTPDLYTQYIYLNGLATAMQNFIKENAMHPQSEDFYKKKMAEYGKLKTKGEEVLKDLQSKKVARLSRKELLEGLIHTLEENEILIDKFDEKLWRLMVEKVVVGTDGMLTFTLRNDMEIEM